MQLSQLQQHNCGANAVEDSFCKRVFCKTIDYHKTHERPAFLSKAEHLQCQKAFKWHQTEKPRQPDF
jgi:hypothetical protein